MMSMLGAAVRAAASCAKAAIFRALGGILGRLSGIVFRLYDAMDLAAKKLKETI